jgi:hypothetical protein
MTSTNAPDLAAETASKRRALKIHAIVFVLVIALLAALDWYTAEPYWIHWVILGWGLGLALHAGLLLRRLRTLRG